MFFHPIDLSLSLPCCLSLIPLSLGTLTSVGPPPAIQSVKTISLLSTTSYSWLGCRPVNSLDASVPNKICQLSLDLPKVNACSHADLRKGNYFKSNASITPRRSRTFCIKIAGCRAIAASIEENSAGISPSVCPSLQSRAILLAPSSPIPK